MKVAFIADSFLYDPSSKVNGTQIQMFNIASALAKKGYEIYYLCLSTEAQHVKQDIVAGINVIYIPNPYRIPPITKLMKQYREILAEIQPHALYQRGRSFLTYLAAKWSQKENILFIWASNGEDSGERWKRWHRIQNSSRPLWRKILLIPRSLWEDKMVHYGIKNATLITSQTTYQQQRLKLNFGRDSTILSSYFNKNLAKHSGPKKNICLWIANITKQKNLEAFIELAHYCRDTGFQFVITGDTPDANYLNQLKRKSGSSVQWLGPVNYETSWELIQQAKVLVNTSFLEADGVSNAMIQAMLTKTAILSLYQNPNNWLVEETLGVYGYGDMKIFLDKSYHFLKNQSELVKAQERCSKFGKKTFCNHETINIYQAFLSGERNAQNN